MRISGFIVSLLVLLLVMPVHGQMDLKPKAIRVGTDLTNLGYTLFADDWTQYEINADLEIDKFFLVLDIGQMDRTWREERVTYNTSGQYWRAGIDYNFFYKKEGIDVMFFGIRYARSNFDEVMEWSIIDPVWGTVEKPDQNINVGARWFEGVFGLKVQIWKQLFLGMTGRLKVGRNVNDQVQLLSFAIPGYGRGIENSTWGFNYHIFWRIPFRRDSVPAKE